MCLAQLMSKQDPCSFSSRRCSRSWKYVCALILAWAKVCNFHIIMTSEGTTIPANTNDPHYFHPAGMGGEINRPGEHGMAIFLAKLNEPPSAVRTIEDDAIVLESVYFYREEEKIQEYIVPGFGDSVKRAPYGTREVKIKLYGAGGGGCGGGRTEETDPSLPRFDSDGQMYHSHGLAGSYIEANLLLPIGEKLLVTIGGGGGSEGSQNDSLGGRGGFNGGYPGRNDLFSGGGGGGGFSSIRLSNGTEIISAFGGKGGGNTQYCSADGGKGGSPKGYSSKIGGVVDENWLASSYDVDPITCPNMPFATELTHHSAAFTWANQCRRTSKDMYIENYVVQLSTASTKIADNRVTCANDFEVYTHLQNSIVDANSTTGVTGLKPDTSYCLLIEAFSKEGLKVGEQISSFTTKHAPTNDWLRVKIHQLREDHLPLDHTNSSLWCRQLRSQPSGRRGHSMSVVNDQIYIFGGATVKCICEFDIKHEQEICSSKNVFSDELWHFNPMTGEFSHLESAGGETPRGREQHSMTVLPDNRMLLIGGISTVEDDAIINDDAIVLGDAWILSNPHIVRSVVITQENSKQAALPVSLREDNITYHERDVSLSSFDFEKNEDMCITDVAVEILLELACTGDLDYISLVANKSHSPGAHETKLFVSSTNSRSKECSNHTRTLKLTFSDNERDSILGFPSLPSGRFRPASSILSSFKGMPIPVEWAIVIARLQPQHDKMDDSSLLNWKLFIDVMPCSARAKWRKLPSNLPARRGHNTVAIDNSIFVSGGYSTGPLNDIWRLDIDSFTWTELKSSSEQNLWPRNGQSSILGPFGVLNYGGVEPGGFKEKNHDIMKFDFISKLWTTVPIDVRTSLPDHRYLTSTGLLLKFAMMHDIFDDYQKEGPSMVMFGGDGGLLTNSHENSYGFTSNSFFGDVWILRLRSPLMTKSPENLKRNHCDWRLKPNSTVQSLWNRSCGWKKHDQEAPQVCRWLDVLIIAWCTEQYQTL